MKIVLWVLTLARLGLLPPFIWIALEAQAIAAAGGDATRARWGAIAIIFVMGLSDVADGMIARRHGLVSQLGAIVDAAADKLAQVVLLVFFTLSDGLVFTHLPLWFVLTVVGRDLCGLVGWLVLRSRYGPIRIVHRLHGRLVTGAVAFVLLFAALGLAAGRLFPILVGTAVFSLVSILAYLKEGVARGRALAGSTG